MHFIITHLNAYKFIYSKWCYKTTLRTHGAILYEQRGAVYCMFLYKIEVVTGLSKHLGCIYTSQTNLDFCKVEQIFIPRSNNGEWIVKIL